jgi:hypothetical protein
MVNDDVGQLLSKYGNQQVKPFKLLFDNDSIEAYTGENKVDFANKYIGGGALSKGCVQEEIMYANHPELYVSIVLC